jgi:anti-sigma factor RsiW
MSLTFNIKRFCRLWLLRRLKPCRQIVVLLSASLDRRLTPGEQIELRLHLFLCAWCARYLKQIKFLRSALRARLDV